MAQEQFKIDNVVIRAPDSYKPVFATTSTEDSKRSQDLIMHNTPMGTIGGYDMQWGELTWAEIATILNTVLNKSQFTFHHKDPTIPEDGRQNILRIKFQHGCANSERWGRKVDGFVY